jgi:hypothetical protein
LVHAVTKSLVKKRWPLILAYGLIAAAGIVASYFISGWISVAVTFAVAVLAFGLAITCCNKSSS